jgi:nitrite reductase (NADH) small subunit/3-phenylpropionate/trans-cinnamate dioxygenase ferredoxin subunit
MSWVSRARTRALVNRDAFVAVARVGDVPLGRAMTAIVDGREIAIFHTAGGFFALDNTCPHQGAPLADGWIDADSVTCPWHAWCFDLASGKMYHSALAGVAAFDVEIDGDDIRVSREPRA